MSVDNRVVNMEFNNKEFEAGISQSQKSLEDFDKSLNNLGKNVDGGFLKKAFSGVGDAIDEVSDRFSALEMIANGALLKIGSQIVEVGEKLLYNFEIAPIAEGWEKYNDTIMQTAGLINTAKFQGYGQDAVDEVLNQLAWYSDATSFASKNMQDALQTLINSNVDLKEAVPLIMGIGNSITYAGQSATKSGEAFQLWAKAMSSSNGMQIRQYDSLVRMGIMTPELTKKIIDQAEALGYLEKAEKNVWLTTGESGGKSGLEVTLENIRDSLGYGKWATKDVLGPIFSEDYGNYALQIYDVVQAQKELDGTILDATEAIERFNKEVEASGGVVDEFGQKTFESSMLARTLADAIDAVKDATSSQWKGMFQAIFGNVDEATELFTNLNTFLVNKFAQPVANAMELVAETMKLRGGGNIFPEGSLGAEQGFFYGASSGRDLLIKSIQNITAAIESFIKPIKDAWNIVFEPFTSKKLFGLIEGFEKLTSKLKLNETVSSALTNVWTVLFKMVNLGVKILGTIGTIIKNLYTIVSPAFKMIGTVIDYLSRAIIFVSDLFSVLDPFGQIVTQIGYKTAKLKTSLKELFSSFQDNQLIVDSLIGAFKDTGWTVENLQASIEKFSENVKKSANALNEVLKPAIEGIKTTINGLIETVFDKLATAYGAVVNFISSFTFSDIINSVKAAGDSIVDFMRKIANSVHSFVQSVFGDSKETIDEEISLLDYYRNKITDRNSIFDKIVDVIHGITKVLTALLGMDIVRTLDKIVKGIKVFPEICDTISSSLKSVQRSVNAEMIKELAIAIGALAASMIIISLIDPEKLGQSIGVIAGLLVAMGGLMKFLGGLESNGELKIGKEGITKSINNAGKMLMQLSFSMVLIAASLRMIDSLEDPWTAFEVITAVLAEYMIIIAAVQNVNTKDIANVGVLFFKFGSAMAAIAAAILLLGEMDPNTLKQGTLALLEIEGLLTAMIGVIALINRFIGKGSLPDVSGLNKFFMSFAISMLAMAGAMKIMDSIENLDGAVGAIAAIMLLMDSIIAILALIPNDSKALTNFSKMLLSFALSMVGIGAAFVEFGIAMNILYLAFMQFSKLSWEEIGKGGSIMVGFMLGLALIASQGSAKKFAALGAGLIGIAIAFSMLVPVILALGNMNIGVLIVGMGAILAFVAGFATVAGVLAVLAPGVAPVLLALGASILMIAVAFDLVVVALTGLVSILLILSAIDPAILAKGFTNLIVSFCAAIVESASAIGEAIVALFTMLMDVIVQCVAKFIVSIGEIITQVVTTVAELMGIDTEQSVFGMIGDIFKKLVALIGKVLKKLWSFIKEKVTGNPDATFGEVIKGIFEHIKVFLQRQWLKLKTKIQVKIWEIKENFKNFGKDIFEGLKQGIEEKKKEIVDKVDEIWNKISGVFKKDAEINSPSKVFIRFGRYLNEGLAIGLAKYSDVPEKAMGKVTDNVVDTFGEALSQIDDRIDDTSGEFTITPVLDLSQIQNESRNLSRMLDQTELKSDLSSYNMGVKVDTTSLIADELSTFRREMQESNANSPTNESLATALKDALAGAGIYMDKTKVGKILTSYQANLSRAGGI